MSNENEMIKVENEKTGTGSVDSKETTRVRIAYKVSAKGIFQPDVTSEAETVETAMANLQQGLKQVKEFAISQGSLPPETLEQATANLAKALDEAKKFNVKGSFTISPDPLPEPVNGVDTGKILRDTMDIISKEGK